MNNKRTWIDKLSDFISGKGFYLVVLVCVAAIALSGWYLVQGVRGGLGDTLDQPVSGSAAIADRPSAAASARLETAPSAAPSVQPAPTPTPAPAPLVFTWPVKGEIVAGFSVEALAHNQTMGDWRTHNGLDIAADRGAQVLAAAAGTVSALYQDDLMGTVVEIDHGQGLVSQYANLAATPTVKVGDAVSTGTIIGSVGGTAALESGLASHIHYALLKEGYPVDPADYLPEQ